MRYLRKRRANIAVYSELLRRIAIRSLFSCNSLALFEVLYQVSYMPYLFLLKSHCLTHTLFLLSFLSLLFLAYLTTVAARRHASNFTMLAWSAIIDQLADFFLQILHVLWYCFAKYLCDGRATFARTLCDICMTFVSMSHERRESSLRMQCELAITLRPVCTNQSQFLKKLWE